MENFTPENEICEAKPPVPTKQTGDNMVSIVGLSLGIVAVIMFYIGLRTNFGYIY